MFGGSRTDASFDPAEVRSVGGGWLHQGQRAQFTWPGMYGERKQNFTGQHFWARGYFVSTVGRDEAQIREYIRNQETEDKRLDQLQMWN